MNIRQIALVAEELAPIQDTLFNLLGIDRGFHDPVVGEFGLHNVVMRLGSSYLEVVSPVREDTTAGRYLQRRGGDSGYMVLVQVADLARERARLLDSDIRIVWEIELEPASGLHLHPADVPGAIASLDEMRPPASWHWGGEEGGMAIPAARHVDAILAVEIESSDPVDTSDKWARAYGRAAIDREGTPVLRMDDTEVRFVPAPQDTAPGLCSIDLRATNFDAVAHVARNLGLSLQGNSVRVCGTTLRFC